MNTTLVLKVSDISPDINQGLYHNNTKPITYSYDIGTIAGAKSDVTWNKIDFKELLGNQLMTFLK